MKNLPTTGAFIFKRHSPYGPVLVLNENSYVMGEYNPRTGKISWQRIVPINQKEQVERWLLEKYPLPKTPSTKR